MKIVLTGSLGHISKPLTQELVGKGHDITVISSKESRAAEIESMGAMAAIGSIEDTEFLASTFAGADIVYTMIPPPDFTDQNLDMWAFYRTIANNYVQAIRDSGVKRVIYLSSIGAHMSEGSGILTSHHIAEGIMNQLSDVNITFMRPTSFYYNLYAFTGAIKGMGMIVSNYGGEDKVSWVSPMDIASAITEEMESVPEHRKIRYVASEDLSCNKVASTLGKAIGIPDLTWNTISDEEMQKNLEGYGLAKRMATGLVEMNSKMHSGELFNHYNENLPATMGKVKLKEFAEEFAAAYQQPSGNQH